MPPCLRLTEVIFTSKAGGEGPGVPWSRLEAYTQQRGGGREEKESRCAFQKVAKKLEKTVTEVLKPTAT